MTETKDSRNNQGCGFAGACGVPHSSGEERKRGELLAAIESPADLRKLPLEALPAVCADILAIGKSGAFCLFDGSCRVDRGTALCVQHPL